MNVIEFFEDELPKLGVELHVTPSLKGTTGKQPEPPVRSGDCTTVVLQGSVGEELTGQLQLTNHGGGLLAGRIQADEGLVVATTQFQKNNLLVTYTLQVSERIREHTATVLTNGGAHRFVFVTALVPQSLVIERERVQSLGDFYDFSLKQPNLAKTVFLKQAFGYWLMAIGYEHVGIYEQLRQDPNRERGFEHFWVFNGLKSPAQVVLAPQTFNFDLNPFNSREVTGTLQLSLATAGYIDQSLVVSEPWIHLTKTRVTTSDFKHQQTLAVDFSIDKRALTETQAQATISLTDCDEQVTINLRKLDPVEIQLSPNHCGIKTPMTLHLTNHTTKPIKVDIEPQDGFVKLETHSHQVTDTLAVPIQIRLSKLMQAQKTMKKRQVFHSVLKVTLHLRDKRVYQDIQLTVGDFKS